MNVLERAKQRYNEIPIPDELSGRIQLEVRLAKERQAEDEKREKVKLPKRPIPFRRLQKSAAAAAAVLLIFAGALNTNMVFAKSAEELPVIGVLARVLTFRSYEEKTDDLEISVEIPSIDVTLPIYHGTSEEVLQAAIGHIEGSSLPVGGASTHCVISGHRGLPSSRLFTDIDQLSEGDIFTLLVLDEALTYEVDQIRIVEPDDISLLEIKEGENLCTLVTCTPYGVNSHRLLVRGHRVENQEATGFLRITADAMMIDSRFVAPVLAAPILLGIILFMVLRPLKRKKRMAAKGVKEVIDG